MNGNGFIYRVGSHTNIIGRPPILYHSRVLLREGCRFASLYAIREADAQAIIEAGTVQGFKGIVWSQRLWVDFDNNQDASDRFRQWLKEQEYNHVVYNTGGRGVHIGVLRDTQPSHLLPLQDRQWVQEMAPGADLSLYWHLHLLRLPGARHENTGLDKRLVYSQEGKALLLPAYSPQDPPPKATPTYQERQGSIFTNWEVVEVLTQQPGSSKHHQLVRLSRRLREAGLGEEEALWVMMEVNRGFDEPKESNEVERICQWAYQGG